MRSKSWKLALVALLFVAVLFARIYRGTMYGHSGSRQTETRHGDDEQPGNRAGHQSVIDPGSALVYTRHARCRMDCRHISEEDIREVLREGRINEAKSGQEPGKCPTYAIEEDRHKDGVRLRIVFAKCEQETKVVTCIDRDHEYECDCK